jgi:hypothetical protein
MWTNGAELSTRDARSAAAPVGLAVVAPGTALQGASR